MRSEPEWLTADDAVRLNRRIVERTGEPHLLLDLGLLESACGVPINRWHYGQEEDVAVLAAALMAAVARNHPFQQGNKRTAYVAGAFFLERNGYRLVVEDTTEVADLFVEVIKGAVAEDSLADLLRENVVPLPGD